MSEDRFLFRLAVCVKGTSEEAAAESGRARLSELELCAVEEAVRISERSEVRCEVLAISLGGATADDALRMCLAVGAHRALHVETDAEVWDGLVSARLLAEALQPLGCSLVLCGQRSHEGMHGMVGPALARDLGYPLLSNVVGIRVSPTEMTAEVTQRLERGDRWLWRTKLPAVCLVEKGINTPRYLSINRLARQQARPVERRKPANWEAVGAELRDRYGSQQLEWLSEARVRPKKTKAPDAAMPPAERLELLRSGGSPSRGQGDKPGRLSGDPEAVAHGIVDFLVEKGFLS